MSIVEKSLEGMLDEIEFEKLQLYWTIDTEKLSYDDIFTSKLFKELKDFLLSLGVKIGKEGKFGYFHMCPTCVALENAYSRGNEGQDQYPITVKVFSGKKGVIVRIRDSGNGFDFKETQQRYINGEIYYRTKGAGFRTYNMPFAEVSFEGNGNTTNIMYKTLASLNFISAKNNH